MLQLPLGLLGETAFAAPPVNITVNSHEGQLKPSGTWSNGNITTYQEGDSINFRFDLTGDAGTAGNMIVDFTNNDGTCNFFDGTFKNLSITNVSGTSPAVTQVGSPTSVSAGPSKTDWQQTLNVAFANAGEAIVGYTLTLTNHAADCNGSSQGSQLTNATVAGDFKNIGNKNVPVPANKLIKLATTGTVTVHKSTLPDPTNTTNFPVSISSTTGGTTSGTVPTSVSTTTDAVFTVTPGTFAVAEDLSNLPGWSQTSNNCSNLVVTAGSALSCTIVNTNSTVFALPASLEITKDARPNGPQDFTFTTTGSGLSNFTLDDDTTSLTPKSVTFNNLAAGQYTVAEDATAGWDLDNIRCTGATTSQSGSTITVTLAAGDNAHCTFVNLQRRGTILGFKYIDTNGDGVHQATEPGKQGWTINLFSGSTTSGTPQATTTTLADGSYGFTNLRAGDYTVCEEQQAGWTQTFPTANSGCYAVTLTNSRAGRTVTDRNFGNFQKNTAAVHKYNDVNGNGIQDANEADLSGWTFNLYGDSSGQPDLSNKIETSAATGTNGKTTFIALLGLGKYWVCEVQQTGWRQVSPTNDACAPISVTTSGGQSLSTFGNVQFTPGRGAGDVLGITPAATPGTPATTTLADTGSSMLINLFTGLAILGTVAGLSQASRRQRQS